MIEPLDLLWYVLILCCIAPFSLVIGSLAGLTIMKQVLERLDK